MSARDQVVKIVDGDNGFTATLKANSMTTFKYYSTSFESTNAPATFTAKSSSNQSSSLTAAKAVDKNTSTRWASNWKDTEWLYLDLGAYYDISGVILNWECGFDSSYKIQTSVNGTTWDTVRTIPIKSTTNKKTELNFGAMTARYLKMQGVKRNNGYGYSIYEISPITQ